MQKKFMLSAFLSLCLSLVAVADQVFFDNFDDGNYDGWTAKQGNWSVASGCLSSTYNYGVIWVDGSYGVNQSLQVDSYFDLTGGQADKIAHLRLRTSDNGSPQTYWDTGYMAEVRCDGSNSSVSIRNTFLGGNPVIASYTFSSSDNPFDNTGWYTLNYSVTGTGSDTHFQLSVNGVTYIDELYANTYSELDSGYIGLGREICYDNFQSTTDIAAVPLPSAILLSIIGLSSCGLLKKRIA